MIYCFEYGTTDHHKWIDSRKQNDIAHILKHPSHLNYYIRNHWIKNLANTNAGGWKIHDITDEVNNWLTANEIKLPLNEDDELLFRLTFE